MIRSMTGYGRAEGSFPEGSLGVELRSVNHRHCDVVVRLPRQLSSLEEDLKKKVQGRFSRGRFELLVTLQKSNKGAGRYTLNLEAAEAYGRILKQLKKKLNLSGEIDVALLSHFRDVISVSEPEEQIAPYQKKIDKILGQALSALEKMRVHEGKALAVDFEKQLQSLTARLVLVQSREKEAVASYHARLQKRVADLSQGLKVDPVRLAQEVAIFAERTDISEERTRLAAHIGQFRKMLRKGGAIGRSLDFLLQEMNREVNTLGSKSNDLPITMEVLAMKGELEKMREQVQNIE